ncbi:tumor necrosis factor receptor superfamily, member a [Chanos chanos]|uniref:Tumor necrosis factor receptor superfamily, member a n=1 Tax=Chanos chanos TaxID=29144 RepID=A0A6J2UV07_CHACN|nr:tumor necrosis factor receptor superfamily member 10B-like [Chanos chanos]
MVSLVIMKPSVLCIVLILHLTGKGTAELPNGYPWSDEAIYNRTARQRSCLENQEYPHNGFCCRNCEAGTYVSKPCTADQEMGTCSPCESGTYAEHPTGMRQCLQCTQCQQDQVMTQKCTSTRNTQCECKPGTFCVPDQPCEVCKKCLRCKADEEEVKKCTATSNTKCVKRPPSPENPTEIPHLSPAPNNQKTVTIAATFGTIILFIVLILLLWWLYKKRPCDKPASPGTSKGEVKITIENLPSVEEKENSQNAGLEEAEEPRPESRPLLQETQGVSTKGSALEDEDRGLGDSLPNTTSSSQTSLSALPTVTYTGDSPRHTPPGKRLDFTGQGETESWIMEDGRPRKLVPLLGEKTSLVKSFDLFESDLDVRFHNKFFRSIGVSDNDIKTADTNHSGDKVYELLKVWMQREGLRASINDLLKALLELDQRYTAEHIASKAVRKGYYRYE